jgi:hypothetical protein
MKGDCEVMETIRERLARDPELANQVADVFGPEPELTDRLTVRFDPKTLGLWPETVRTRSRRNRLKKAHVVEYVENPAARTPSGGKYTSRRFTVIIEGVRWYGTVKNGTDIVRLRRADSEL